MIPTFVCLPSDAAEFKQLFRDKLVLHILGLKRSEGCKNFAGWGGEDDNFSRVRLTPSGHEIVRFDSDVSRYRALKHKTNRGNKSQIDGNHNRISKVQSLKRTS